MPIELPPGTASYSDRSHPPRNRQLLLIFGLTVAVVMGFFWLLGVIANGLVWLIPPGVERQLGVVAVPLFEQQAKPSPTQDTLNQLLDRLEAQLPDEQRRDRDYQVLFIPDTTVNALAIPGDRVIIYAGLLDQMESENELMMVMGHELGHFAHRDHLRGLGRDLVFRLTLAAVLGDVGSIQAIAISGAKSLGDAQFSQTQEYQADDFGLELLNGVYGQVAGATDFFTRLSQEEGLDLAFLSTHPASEKRVKRLEQLIQERSYATGARSPLPLTLE